MATIANLKTAFTADTSGLKKGSAEAKSAIKDFEKVGNESLSSLAQAFGLNTAQIEKLSNAAKGAAAVISKNLKLSTDSAKALASSIGMAAGAVAGLSVAGIVMAWKELNAEVDYYYASMQGSIDKAGLEAYVSTLKGATMEMRNLADNAERMIGMQTGWANFTNTLKSAVAGMLGFSTTGSNGVQGMAEGIVAAKAAQQVAAKAAGTAKEMQELTVKLAENEYKIYEYDQRIAEAKLKAKDATNETAVRQAALSEAQALINKKVSELQPIYAELARLQEKYNSYTLTSIDDMKKLTQYRQAAAGMVKQQSDQSRELLELSTQIAKKAQEEAAARQAALDAVQQVKEHKETTSGLSGTAAVTNAMEMPTKVTPMMDTSSLEALGEQIQEYVAGLELNADVKANFNKTQAQLAEVNAQLTTYLQDAVSTGLSGLGEAIGSAITGAEEPGAILLNTVATLMKQLGELAIASGVAMLGIKAALESMNPYAAIAAGVALVALATVISATTSNMASSIGGTSSGSSGYTSSYTSSNITGSNRTQEVKVTGTLKASGDDLIAVIENTENKNYYTR